MGHSFQFFCAQSSCFVRFWVHFLVYLRVILCAHISLPRCIPVKRLMGRLTSLLLWPPRSLSAHVCMGTSLWPLEELHGLSLLSGQGSAPPPLHFGITVHRAQTPAVQPGICLSPASVQFNVILVTKKF